MYVCKYVCIYMYVVMYICNYVCMNVCRYFYHCALLCTLCTVSCSIWTVTAVDRLLYMFAITNKLKILVNFQKEQRQRRSICHVISPVRISYISGRHSVHKIR